MEDTKQVEQSEDTGCGFGSCKPTHLQKCENLTCFAITDGCLVFMTVASFAFLSTQITSIEKQFNINSETSGTLISASDIGYLSAVLLTTHFLKRYSIPKVLGTCGVIYGFLVMSKCILNFVKPVHLPQDMSKSNTTQSNSLLCNTANSSMGRTVKPLDGDPESDVNWTVWVFGIIMALQGTMVSTRTSLSTIYVDDNLKDRSKTGIFLGGITAASALGPAVSLLLGGAISKLPVDLSDTVLSPKDPRWVSAWWLGFVLLGVGAILTALPTLMFPKRMSTAPVRQQEQQEMPLSKQIKDLPLSIWRTLTRPIFVLAVSARCIQLFATAGMIAFGPKYLQTQFNIPAYQANLMLGIVHIVTNVFGTFIGGVLTGKLRMTMLKCTVAVIVFNMIGIAFNCLGLVFGCDNTPIEGIDFIIEMNVTSDTHCYCDSGEFLPSCGDDGITYFSPCHAQCYNLTANVYGGCRRLGGLSVTPGICDNGCQYLIPYLASVMLMSAITTMALMPHYILIIRSVKEKDRAIGLGLLDFSASLLGFVPSPVVYGKVIDSACKFTSSTGQGACSLYDLVDLRKKVFGMEVGIRLFAVCLVVIVYFLCRIEERNGNSEEIDTELSEK